MPQQKPQRYWSTEEATTFYQQLLEKALSTIPENGAVMVLGPMFCLRTPEENFARFEMAQSNLIQQGLSVFNQVAFVDYVIGDAPFEYELKFNIFYKPLIQSGKIKGCYLLPDWSASQGTITEIEFAKSYGLQIIELSTSLT